MGYSCDLSSKYNVWPICASLGASVLFTILFGLSTIAHLLQAIRYRKGYCWVIVLSAFIQTLCYFFRTLSIVNYTVYNYYVIWFVLILVCTSLRRKTEG